MKFSEIKLSKGSHTSPSEGLCVMEAVAYFAGEKHSDKPQCACPVITEFAIKMNDTLPDSYRDRMKAMVPLIVGTRDGNEKARAEYLAWTAIRVFAPMALEDVGLPANSKTLREFKGSLKEASDAAYAASREAYDACAYAAARAAADVARAAADAARAAADAARSADDAARAAAYATHIPDINKDKIYETMFTALEDILAIGRPDFSETLNEIDKIKATLPSEPEFKQEAIDLAKVVYVERESK